MIWGARTFKAVAAAAAATILAGCALTRESAPPVIVDQSFTLIPINFRNGPQSALALQAFDESGRVKVCAAIGVDESQEHGLNYGLAEEWIRFRRVTLGGRTVVGDLSFATLYSGVKLVGRSSNCVISSEPVEPGDEDDALWIEGVGRIMRPG